MKKRCFNLLQVDAKALLLSRHSITKDLKFSHAEGGRVWHIPINVYLNDIGILGDVRIYSRCPNANLNTCELVSSNIELTDDATYTYFLLFQGNRESVNKCFVPTIEINEDNYSQDIADLNERVDTAEGNIQFLQEDLGALIPRVDAVEENVGNIQIDLGIAQSDIGTLQGDMSSAQSDIANLQTDLSDAEGNISTLQTDLGTAQGDIGTLQSEVSTVQGDISTLQTGLNTAQGDIGTLQSDMLSAQSDIVKLQTKMDEIYLVGETKTGMFLEVPEGWLLCDGSVIDKSAIPEYENLVNLLRAIDTAQGTTHFTNGLNSNQAKLPDMERALLYMRTGALGEPAGNTTHNHSIEHNHPSVNSGTDVGTGTPVSIQSGSGVVAHIHQVDIPNYTGNSGNASSYPPVVAVMMIIKY